MVFPTSRRRCHSSRSCDDSLWQYWPLPKQRLISLGFYTPTRRQGGEADAAEPFEPIELEKRALLTMPGGWKMAQMHAEQPATTYAEFKREILNEIARCLNMPFNVALAIRRVTTRVRATRSPNLLQVDPCRAITNGSHRSGSHSVCMAARGDSHRRLSA